MDVKLFSGACALLLTICTTQAFLPKNKELIYEYEGTISASTRIPKLFVSKFKLRGNLHVRTEAETAVLRLSDPKYELFNGLGDDYDSKLLPIPEDQSAFSKEFKIKFEPSGNIAGISFFGDEKQYVMNFKKAMSGLLQLDVENIGKHDKENFAFHTEENTLFGRGKVFYNVQTDKSSYHLIDIMQEPRDTKHLYKHAFSNVEYENFDFDEPLSRDCQRKVFLGKETVIEWVQQTGGIYHQPFNAEGEAHVIYVSQNLTLIEIKNAEEKMNFSEVEVFYNHLDYRVANFKNIDSTFPDFTNDRRDHSREDVIVKVFDLIKEVKELKSKYKIKKGEPDYKQAYILNRLTEMLLYFDEKLLDELFGKIMDLDDGKIFDIYLESLIETGTHSVYYHLIKLIKEEKINNHNGDSIQDLFVSVKFPNKKLVDDMAEVLKWDCEYEGGIKSRVILSFGTLLHKAVLRHQMYSNTQPKMQDYKISGDFENDFPSEEYYEKHLEAIVENVKSADKKDKQILYLQTLHNTYFESLPKHLLPCVKADFFKDDYLTFLTTSSMSSAILKKEDLTFETYWPILTDHKAQTSFRIMAYFFLMKAQPSLPRLINIYWLMETMKNHEIYKFHYDYITQMSESGDPKIRKFALSLRQILKYTSKPVFWGLTSYNYMDYFDEKYSLGEQVDLMLIHSKNENDLILSGSYKHSRNGLSVKPYWFFLRLSGFEPSLLKELKLDPTSNKALFTWDNVLKALMHAVKNKNASVTMIYAKNGHVIYSSHYENLYDIYELYELYLFEKYEFWTSTINPTFDLSQFTVIPTDLGFPAIIYNQRGHVDFLDFNVFKNPNAHEYMFDLKMKMLMSTRRGLSFYNPFLDVQQGVSKINFEDQEINMKLNVTFDLDQSTLKAAWRLQDSKVQEDIYTKREYASGVVYLLDDFNKKVLQQSNPACKNFEKVTMGDAYGVNRDGGLEPMLDIGHDYREWIFDLESQLPSDLDPNYIPGVESADTNDVKSYIRSIIRSTRIQEIQPENVNYGIFRKIYLNKFYEVTQFDLALKLDTEYKKGQNLLYPAVVHKFKLHFASGNAEGVVTTWVADARISRDEGHMNNNFAVNIAKTFLELEIKVCAKGDVIWTSEEFKGKLSLSTNILEDMSCGGEDALITLEILGEQSAEQKNNLLTYDSCYENVNGMIKHGKTLDCLFEYSSLRKFTIRIDHVIPQEKQDEYSEKISKKLEKVFTDVKPIYPIEDVKENEIRVVFVLPMKPAENINLLVYMENYGLAYEVPENIQGSGLSTVFGSTFEYMHELGLTDFCVVDNIEKKIINGNGEEVEKKASPDWDLYLSQSDYKIYIKSTEGGHMAIKVVYKEHSLVIEPSDKKYTFSLDGNKFDNNQTYFTNDWVYFAWIKNTKIVSIYVRNVGFHVIFNGNQMSIEYPQIKGVDMQGHCFDERSRTI